MSEAYSEDEKQAIINAAQELGYGYTSGEAKQSVHTFLHNVATAKDTTKLGYLKDEEIGVADNPTRAHKFLSVYARDIMKNDALATFFGELSEITTSTSLSRNAKLINLAVVQKREVADVTKPMKENKGWFRKKDDSSQGEQLT